MNDVNSNEKEKRIQMYLTARQFKNAITKDEMFIIPAKLNNLAENTMINFANMFGVTARGNKVINKIFPFLVNKAFACEVFLKLILMVESIDFKKEHNLFKLYDLTSVKKDCVVYFRKYDNKIDNNYIDEEIKKISNIFKDWRYIYEHFDEGMTADSDFLNTFCDFLDTYTISLIKSKYDYDVSNDYR